MGMLVVAIYASVPRGPSRWDAFVDKVCNSTLYMHPRFASKTPEDVLRDMKQFMVQIAAPFAQGLRPAIIANGGFANVPSIAVPGDQIWVLQGCRLPVVLRKSKDRPGMFQLVGNCHCSSVMDGEAVRMGGSSFVDIRIH